MTSVKGLTAGELTIAPDHEEPQEYSDGEIEVRMKACTLFNLAKKSCKLGIC